MSVNNLLSTGRQRMQKSVDAYSREIATIRAGRANASILDRVEVSYYGVMTPLNQLAGISIPEARMLLISPYDKSSINDIETAILKSDIGITPNNDGDVIRLVIPALTKERRQELSKVVGGEQEKGKVAIRNIRRDLNDEAKKLEEDSQITEDELRRLEDDIQKLTDEFTAEIDRLTDEKIKEIMED